jgi:hypothetical protein
MSGFGWLCALEFTVDGCTRDVEEFRQFGLAVGAGSMDGEQVTTFGGREFWLFPAELAFGFRDCHPFACSHSDQVGLELCDHAEDVEKQPAHGIGGIVDRSAKAQGDALPCQLVSDITGVWKRPRQAVEFGDDKSDTETHRGHRFAESGPGPVGAGKSVVNMDGCFQGRHRGR